MTNPIPSETASIARPRNFFPLFPVACLATLLLVLLGYSNTLQNSFHFDDSHAIVDNPYIRDLRNIPRFFTDGGTFSTLPSNANYRPLVSLTMAMDYRLGHGLAPRQFHITQIVLLCLTGALLALLFTRILATAGRPREARWLALLAATLFCVHTGNTESFNYISARSDILSGIGVLGALVCYAWLPGARRYGIHILPMVFGALAKTSAVIAAPLLLAYRLLIEDQMSIRDVFSRAAWPRTRRALWSTAPAFVAGILLFRFVESMNPPGQNYGGGDRLGYLLTQCWVWVHYFRLFLLPNVLSADTDLGGIPTWKDPRVLLGLAFIGALLASCWIASRRPAGRPAAFGLAWFAIALLPSSSIFPLAEMANDHRILVPFMGLSLAAVALGALWLRTAMATASRPSRALTIGAAVVVLVLSAHLIGTLRRNRVWRSEETLWADVMRKSPGNGRGLMNYGLTQMARGRYAVAEQLFLRAERMLPAYAILQVNLGIVGDALGNASGAGDHFARALGLAPNDAVTHRYYARWLIGQSRAGEAILHLERALALAPADLDARHQLLGLYAARGARELKELALSTLAIDRSDTMAAAYARGIGPNMPAIPGYQSWFDVGVRLTSASRHAEAAEAYRAALQFDPASADAWNNLGWSLARLGLYDDALPAFRSAIQAGPALTLAANNLAWATTQAPTARFLRGLALIQTGRDAEAVPIYKELIASVPDWTNAHFNLGCALLDLHRFPEARDEFYRTIGLLPSSTAARANLATCLDSLGQPAEAARVRASQTANVSAGGAGAGTR